MNQLLDNSRKIYPIHQVNFLNKGNAINFVYPQLCNEMLSPYIYLTFSALLKCALNLEKGDVNLGRNINVLSTQEEQCLISDFLLATKGKGDNKNDLFIQQVRKSKIWRGL